MKTKYKIPLILSFCSFSSFFSVTELQANMRERFVLAFPDAPKESVDYLLQHHVTLKTLLNVKKYEPCLTMDEIYRITQSGIEWGFIERLKEVDPRLSLEDALLFHKEKLVPFEVIDLKTTFKEISISEVLILAKKMGGSYQTKEWKKRYPTLSLTEIAFLIEHEMPFPSPQIFDIFLKKNEGNFLKSIEDYLKNEKSIKKLQRSFLKKYWTKLHLKEGRDFELESKLNEAIWDYEAAGTPESYEKALILSETLETLLKTGEIEEVQKLFGATDPRKVRVTALMGDRFVSVYAVMKKDCGKLYSNIKSERFASLLNDFLGLHIVPKTILREVKGTTYSLQYFWRSKDSSESKNELMRRDLKVFDYLTNNADRHEGNLFIDGYRHFCGRHSYIIGIDHGGLWGRGHHPVRHTSEKHLIPSVRFYKALLSMNEDQFREKVMREELVSEEELSGFFKRKKEVLSYMLKDFETKTADDLWPNYESYFLGRKR